MCVSSRILDELAKVTASENMKMLREHIEASGIVIIRSLQIRVCSLFHSCISGKEALKNRLLNLKW